MVSDKEVIAKVGHIYNTSFGLAIVIRPTRINTMKVKILDNKRNHFISGEYPEWGRGYANVGRSCLDHESQGLYTDDFITLVKLILLGRSQTG